MSTWTMGWGDDEGEHLSALPHEAWKPMPVPPGTVRVAEVVIFGLGLLGEPLLVAWDDQRSTVRSSSGQLLWYVDETRQAYPRAGEIVIEDHREHPYPRGNRSTSALIARSLEDLVETVNAEKVTRIDNDGTIHMEGRHDNSRGEATRSPDTGIILRAAGVQGTAPWELEATATYQVPDQSRLLSPADTTPPAST